MKIKIPEISGSETDMVLAEWHVAEGDFVREGDDLLEIVTDKAAFDMPSPCSGVVSSLIKRSGDGVQAGDIVAEIKNNVKA